MVNQLLKKYNGHKFTTNFCRFARFNISICEAGLVIPQIKWGNMAGEGLSLQRVTPYIQERR